MKNIVGILTLVFIISSCENFMFEDDLASKDPRENFDYLWNECNEKFSYFDVKNIDWDDIKVKYSQKIYEGMTQDSLFNVLAAMLDELKDGHTQLFSTFNASFYGAYYTGQDNFDWRIIEDNYLHRDYYNTGPFRHSFISNNEIGYIYIPSFPEKVSDNILDFIIDRYKNTKGLILDLRENQGGSPATVLKILSRFVETKTLVGYSRIKSGPGHNEFSNLIPFYVTPYNNIRYTNKVAVLTDRATFSGGSYFSLFTRALPNMILIGDTTAGGLGAPNGGQLPNGWRYRFSVTQLLTPDKNPEYENGVPPDIQSLFDWNNLTKDEVIERALAELQ